MLCSFTLKHCDALWFHMHLGGVAFCGGCGRADFSLWESSTVGSSVFQPTDTRAVSRPSLP